MTIGQTVERANVSETADGSPSWADVAVRFANRMAWADFSRGSRQPQADASGKARPGGLLAAHGSGRPAGQPQSGGQMGTDSSRHRVDDVGPGRFYRNAHDGYTPVGRALFLGSDTQHGLLQRCQTPALTARGSTLRSLLARMFRMAAASGVRLNWREILHWRRLRQ